MVWVTNTRSGVQQSDAALSTNGMREQMDGAQKYMAWKRPGSLPDFDSSCLFIAVVGGVAWIGMEKHRAWRKMQGICSTREELSEPSSGQSGGRTATVWIWTLECKERMRMIIDFCCMSILASLYSFLSQGQNKISISCYITNNLRPSGMEISELLLLLLLIVAPFDSLICSLIK